MFVGLKRTKNALPVVSFIILMFVRRRCEEQQNQTSTVHVKVLCPFGQRSLSITLPTNRWIMDQRQMLLKICIEGLDQQVWTSETNKSRADMFWSWLLIIAGSHPGTVVTCWPLPHDSRCRTSSLSGFPGISDDTGHLAASMLIISQKLTFSSAAFRCLFSCFHKPNPFRWLSQTMIHQNQDHTVFKCLMFPRVGTGGSFGSGLKNPIMPCFPSV